MRRLFLILLMMALPALAQDPPAQAPATPAAAAPTPAPAVTTPTTPAPAASADAASPVPDAESWLTGSIDLGYRWRTDVGGSLDTYRSFINLGSGPKVLGADLTLLDLKHRAFDRITVRASGWGGEPYQTFHLNAKQSKLYDFSADYRDIAYFDFLPSFADPLLARGIALNEQSFDTHRRTASFHLELLPDHWLTPYLDYDRDSGHGTGATTFVTDANQFPVPNTMDDLTNLYRGGVRLELRRVHATLEEGGTTFTNNQNLYQNPSGTNYGNVLTPSFGQTTDLASLLAAYGVRGTSIYSKALFTANATSWLDLYGQFLYSQPDTTVNYQQADTGNLLLQNQVLFYTSQQYLVAAASKLPHTTGSLGAEIRPIGRVRILESWLTDRMHNAGSAVSTQTLSNAGASEQMAALLASSLITNYSQEEINIIFDATSKLVLRGGYRYVWGDASDVVLPPAGLASSDQAKLRRNVGLGGVTFRPRQKLSLTADTEVASSGGAYFRTSLYNYQKVRAQARYQLLATLGLTADFTLLDDQNPVPGVNYAYTARQESFSLFWSPAGGKTWDLQGSYSRSSLHSDIGYLEPETLTGQTSLYRDNTHTATALFNVKLRHAALTPKITAGGSFFISSGSRPTSYYQPLATLWVPSGKKLTWFAEWRYYGYGEAFYLYEGFRAHTVTAGVRFTP